MENLERINSKYPLPPTYYKDFEEPNSKNPPDLNIISKMNSFKSFGVEYKTKNINIFLNPVDVSKIKKEEIKKYSLENMEYFQNLNDSNGNYIGYNFIKSETINFNPIKELENEINFIKKRYKILLDNLCNNIDGAEIDVKLIRLSFQKVFFYLQILKKKQILNEAIKFFKKENERNKLIENQLKENINNFQNLLSENLKEIKGDLRNIDD